MTDIIVCDVETTGMGEDADVCQLGWCTLELEKGIIFGPTQIYLRPAVTIPPEEMAIHHITNREVEGEPRADEFLSSWNLSYADPSHGDAILCAHNAEFEKRWLGTPNTRWICTLKGARRVWPDAPSHGNQVLRYWLDLDDDPGFRPQEAHPPHHAGPDAYVTAHILQRLLEHATVDELIQWSGEPSLLTKFHFGKHAGVPLADVPSDYLRWMTRQESMDPDATYTARTELDRRGGR